MAVCRCPDERHRPAARPAIRHAARPPRARSDGLSTSTIASDSTRAATFSSSTSIVFEQIVRARRPGCRSCASACIGVERRLERRVVGQRLGLRAQLALARRFNRGEQPLRRFEIRRDRLPDLIADAERDDDEDDRQQQRDGHERDGQRLDEQPGRTPRDRSRLASSTGSDQVDRGGLAGFDDVTVGALADALVPARRACTCPAGTAGSSNEPSSSGIVKYGWSNTRIVALMCEWMCAVHLDRARLW